MCVAVLYLLETVMRLSFFSQLYAANLSSRTLELRREKRRSDRLIYQMLPEPVAMQLRDRKLVLKLS